MEKIIKELEQKKVELTKELNSVEQAIKLLSKKDISPTEKWLLGRIEGAKPKTQSNGVVDWNKDGYWLFQQDFINGRLWVSYPTIWSVLRNEFCLNKTEIQDILSKVLYNHTNNGKLKIKF